MSDVPFEHPSVLIWPLPRGTKYPHTQEVKCALCGKRASRVITARVQAKNLWFCCTEHRLIRRAKVLRGEHEVLHASLPKQPLEGGWGDLGLNPRRDIKALKMPTPYDELYGTMSSHGDLRE
jgi:hypothetical protein